MLYVGWITSSGKRAIRSLFCELFVLFEKLLLVFLPLFLIFARHLLRVALIAKDLKSESLSVLDLLLPSGDHIWVFLSGVRLQSVARFLDILVERVVILVVVVPFKIRCFFIEIDVLDCALSFLILDNVVSFAAQAASERVHGLDWVS